MPARKCDLPQHEEIPVVYLLRSSRTECLVVCDSESTFSCTCLIILSYIAVYNHDTYVHVSSASVSSVGMLIVKQHLHLEITIWKFFNNG